MQRYIPRTCCANLLVGKHPKPFEFFKIDFEAQSTLSYALSNGILDLDRVHELCMASKREQAKALHPYSITPPAKEGERWRTNYTDRNGKRKTIRAQTEEALLDKLIPLYLDRENLEKKTFQELFEEWIAYKAQITTSPNTILRHRHHFKNFQAVSDSDFKDYGDSVRDRVQSNRERLQSVE